MARENEENGRRPRSRQRRGDAARGWMLAGGAGLLLVAAAVLGLRLWGAGGGQASGTAEAPDVPQKAAPRYAEAVEFRMTDLEQGWIRYTDGWKTTVDGGVTWREADGPPPGLAAAAAGAAPAGESGGSGAGGSAAKPAAGAAASAGSASAGSAPASSANAPAKADAAPALPSAATPAAAAAPAEGTAAASDGKGSAAGAAPAGATAPASAAETPDYTWLRLKEPGAAVAALHYEGADYPAKQVQMMTDRIGWALVQANGPLGGELLATTDGGALWQRSAGSDALRTAIGEERELLRRREAEAALYASPDLAKQAFAAAWTLLPDTASRGDAVLVRHDQPGEVLWQGRTYALQPYGAGWFTYLPIGMEVKDGAYPIGDRTLKITAKRFETQYLKVTEEMDSMRQDTKRIDADQKKIDAARSRSETAFLFREPFLLPVNGRLTTPYGYTRYVNGKLSGSHMAIDLAAKEGTPVRATNDGIVALADSLYLTGNSIYLDHGMHLFSQYAHLSRLDVKTGDRVKRGDVIGLVGTTGFSTGPHLHFTFWVHNVQANPNLFFDASPFGWGSAAGGKP